MRWVKRNFLAVPCPKQTKQSVYFTSKLKRKMLLAHNSLDSLGHVQSFPTHTLVFLSEPLVNNHKLILPVANRRMGESIWFKPCARHTSMMPFLWGMVLMVNRVLWLIFWYLPFSLFLVGRMPKEENRLDCF